MIAALRMYVCSFSHVWKEESVSVSQVSPRARALATQRHRGASRYSQRWPLRGMY
jgi:hypothetical protein